MVDSKENCKFDLRVKGLNINIVQTSDENKHKYQSGDYQLI